MGWLWNFKGNGEAKAALTPSNIDGWEQFLNQQKSETDAAYYVGVKRNRAMYASSIPRKIRRASDGAIIQEKELPFKFQGNSLMWRSVRALDSFGAAYYGLKLNRGGGVRGVKWFDPTSIRIEEDIAGGIHHFERIFNGHMRGVWGWDDEDSLIVPNNVWGGMAYVHALGMNEYGPGESLDQFAALPAKLLLESDKLLSGLFERGAINQHAVFTPRNPGAAQKNELRQRLQRFLFGGSKNAHNVEVLNAELRLEKIGTDPKDLALKDIDEGNRTDINVVSSTPGVIVDPGHQINRASLDRITSNYINFPISHVAQHIIDEWNRQIFEPAGYEMSLDAQSMSVEQVEEKNRAQAYALFVGAGNMPAETAIAVLGIDVPEGMPLVNDQRQAESSASVESIVTDDVPDDDGEPTEAKSAELAKLRRFVARGKHNERVFKSEILSQDEIDDIIMGEAASQDSPFTHELKNDRVRNKWEREALEVFRRVYLNQWNRTRRVIRGTERAELRGLLEQFFQNDPTRVAADVGPFFDDLMSEVSAAALREIGSSADPDPIMEAIIKLSDDTAAIFANTMTATSRRMTFSIIESWLLDEGATIGQLTDRLSRIWTGPRPDAAATTESTRLVAESRRVAWEANGAIWGYEVRTKNDGRVSQGGRVRDRHQDIADNGPYPLSDTEHLPPFGDVNCRCTIVAVLEPPE